MRQHSSHIHKMFSMNVSFAWIFVLFALLFPLYWSFLPHSLWFLRSLSSVLKIEVMSHKSCQESDKRRWSRIRQEITLQKTRRESKEGKIWFSVSNLFYKSLQPSFWFSEVRNKCRIHFLSLKILSDGFWVEEDTLLVHDKVMRLKTSLVKIRNRI